MLKGGQECHNPEFLETILGLEWGPDLRYKTTRSLGDVPTNDHHWLFSPLGTDQVPGTNFHQVVGFLHGTLKDRAQD